jgi:hypothetical protein
MARYVGHKADKMNARLGQLLRARGVDTCQEPYASVLGGHKYPKVIETEPEDLEGVGRQIEAWSIAFRHDREKAKALLINQGRR